MEEQEDADVSRLRKIAAQVGEHFGDFLIVARCRDGMIWKHSDPTWGVGAAERYTGIIKDQALIERIQSQMED